MVFRFLFLIFVFILTNQVFISKSLAGFYVNAQETFEQIKISEPGTSGTISSTPGLTLNIGFDFSTGAKNSRARSFGIGANYSTKSITFLGDDLGSRNIIQQPPTIYSIEAKLFMAFGRTYFGALYNQRDLIFIESITQTGISLNIVSLPLMGIEIGSNASSGPSLDIKIFLKGLYVPAKKLETLDLLNGNLVAGGIRFLCFQNKWLELNATAYVTTLNFSDSKQTNVQGLAGLGFSF